MLQSATRLSRRPCSPSRTRHQASGRTTFCSVRYGVSFPLTAKYAVSGKDAHPLYQWIAAQAGEAAAPRWNFHKYLIDRKGELVDVFPSKVAPESKQLVEAIEEQLGS